MRTYLDTNAVHSAVAAFSSAPDFDKALQDSGCQVALGFHVIYELARAFTSSRSQEATLACFRLLAGMEEVYYVPQAQDLIMGEVAQAGHGGVVIHRVSDQEAAAIRSELYLLQQGHAGDARRFIARREKKVELGHPRISAANRTMIEDLLRRQPEVRPALRTFDGFRTALRLLWPRYLVRATGPLPAGYAERILNDAERFPVLNTWLNCELHLSYLSWSSGTVPSRSRLDDYRHALESCAADIFVSGDDPLLRLYPALNPFRRAMSWDEFARVLSAPAAR